MNEDRRIVWLASYPKSGNTWMRILLHGIAPATSGACAPDINALDATEHAAARWLVEAVSACPTSELGADEIDRLRPMAYGALLQRRAGPVFVKTHDAYRLLDSARPLFPASLSRRVIHLVRNPLDVAVSFSSHLGIEIDKVIDLMATDYCVDADSNSVTAQVRQYLGTWSSHVRSWQHQSQIPVLTIRYEDLVADTVDCLNKAADAVGLEVSDDTVEAAVEAAKFDRLQAMERRAGFREKPPTQDGLFFRSGRVDGWREVLSRRQAERVANTQKQMMARFGYLDTL